MIDFKHKSGYLYNRYFIEYCNINITIYINNVLKI
ncbi:Uncharacterised protein [Clostridioides difficile]|nr:Uncharacterised protein [Clostridioides difficile]VIF57789.1 Uncharacterised protein [Clostridioides difficile]VIF59517.1 Uncharacterised protein [Clostridioides difficile]VIF64275.1 Uncharacterised protein [Clostridioides difficile]